ncbi:unnamed protein product [Acanthoscelides obtectus]|uniref:Cyclic nucleotide-binding domain-containing protein n=1 Tax=Acanthoscelides obtectus TaxID=200917 RepID=A0A9P0NUW2_ACAOB|nr:unnamed protein product [Acanthoscelides obtectus]CAK1642791.1 Potassium/sodium hyperpolarization-activated cyclic nucleotide-gated channel 2 [Acanthoscelides obtectus]
MTNLQWEHQCRLKHKKGPVINHFVDSGVLIPLRRTLKLSMMLNENHPFCEGKYKSWKDRRSEQIRQLVKHPTTVHPFSSFQMYWEYMMCLMYFFSYMILCINSAYSWRTVHRAPSLLILISICDIIVMADIAKQFVTGYYNNETHRSILRLSSIAKKYISTYFVFDVLTCAETFLRPFALVDSLSRNQGFARFYRYSRIFTGLRIVRLPRMPSAFDMFVRRTNIKNSNANTLKALLIFVVIFMWLYFVQFTTENFIEYITSDRVRWKLVTWHRFYSATLQLMKVSVGETSVDSSDHVAAVIVTNNFIVMGWIIEIYLVAVGLQLWNQYSSSRNKNDVVRKQFMRYASYKRLPPNLRKKFFAFYDFKFKNGVYKERHIYNNASLILRQQIQVYVTRNYIGRVEFFQILPERLLLTLSTKLKTEVFLTNDVIVSSGDVGVNMYFIRYGTVALYTPSGKEMYHVDDGAHFGEISILFEERRIGSAIAVR